MALLAQTLAAIEGQDAQWRRQAHARLEQLTMPYWALGRLMDLAEDLAGMTRSLRPPVAERTIVTMAGDHGVTAEGVSKYPSAVTMQMVHNFVAGGAGINALARVVGARVVVVDMGVAGDLSALVEARKILSGRVAAGTQNLAQGPAMTHEQAVQSLETGIGIALELSPFTEVYGTGEMGIGNTTPASAIVAVLTGCDVGEVTGRGTGLDDAQRQHKARVIEQALAVNQPVATDGLDVLAKVGGFEIGGLAGLILGAARLRKPVVVDGFISTAAALIAQALCPAAAEYMVAAHRGEEPGHRAMLQRLGKEPLMDLNMRLGEGTGAALAMAFVEGAARLLTDVATFGEAAVSEADK